MDILSYPYTKYYKIGFDVKTGNHYSEETAPPPAEYKFCVGQEVEKHTGDYIIKGEVRACFKTKAGKQRFVVEHVAQGGGSFLHIYSEANLRLYSRPSINEWTDKSIT